MPLAKLRNVTLYYEWSGSRAHPVLVLSNSLGTDHQLWNQQVLALSSRFRVLRYDTRGHGQSSVPPGPYTMAVLGQDVLDLLDSLRVKQAALCGVSLGGLTALWLAVHAPERFSRIIAANVAVQIARDRWQERIADVQRRGMISLVGGSLGRWFTPDFLRDHPDAVSTVQWTLATLSGEGYVACCAAIRDFDPLADAGSIHLPTLLITGTHDETAPPSDAALLQGCIAASQVIELAAAHLSNIEAAEPFTEAVLAFLEPLRTPQQPPSKVDQPNSPSPSA